MLGKYSFGFAGLGTDGGSLIAVDPDLIAEKETDWEKEPIAQVANDMALKMQVSAYGMPPVHAGPTAAGKTWSAGTLAGILIAAGILGKNKKHRDGIQLKQEG